MANMRANIELAAKKKGFLAFDELKGGLSKVSTESARTRKELQQLNQRTAAVQQQMRSATASVRNFILGMGAGLGAVELAQEILSVGQAVDGLKSSFTATFGQQQVATEMNYIRQVANDLGLEMLSTAESYAQWAASAKGTVLEGQAQKDIFESVAQASRVLNLSVDDTNGTLRALSQMISKGKVQAEELRGQLGERLPGAFQMAAKAMGVSTAELDKMLQTGQVLAQDLLPKLAIELDKAYGGEARAAAVQSLAAETNRLKNSMTELSLAIYEAIEPQLAQWARNGAEAATYLAENLHLIEGAAVAVAAILAGKYMSSIVAATAASLKAMQIEQQSAAASVQAAAAKALAANKVAQAEAQKAAKVLASMQLSKSAAQAEMASAKASLVAANGTDKYAAALARLNLAQTASRTASAALVTARKNSAVATTAAAEAAAIAATRQTAAATATSRVGVVAGVAAKGVGALRGAFALLGGPIGVAITAIGALIYYLDDLKAYAESSGIADRFATEFEHIADSWSGEMAGLPEVAAKTSDQVVNELRAGLSDDSPWQQLTSFAELASVMMTTAILGFVDDARKLITYLPQYYDTVMRTLPLYTQAAVETSLSYFETMRAGTRVVFAAIVDGAAHGFGLVGDVVGQVVGFILDRFADMAKVFTAVGGLADMLGLDGLGNSLKSIESGISSMADTTRGFGDGIRAEFGSMAAGIRDSAVESAVAARAHDENAASALESAAAIWRTTDAAIAEAETMRQLSLEMNEAEAQFAALDAQGNATAAALKAGEVAADGVAGAVGAAGVAADKAAGSKQKLTEAQKSAAKAADELAKAQQKIADQFAAAEQKQAVLTETLRNGEAAGRQLELRYDSMHNGVMLMTQAQAEELQKMEAANTAIEEQIKQREELEKAIQAASDAVKQSAQDLEIAHQALGMNDEQLRALTLSYEKGYTKAQAAAQAANEAQTKSLQDLRSAQIAAQEAVEDAAKSLQLAEASIGKTDQAVRELELSLTQGYTPAQAAAQAADEARIKSLNELRTAQQNAQKAVDESEKSLQLARDSYGKTEQQIRAMTLSLTQGYTPAQAAAQAQNETLTAQQNKFNAEMQKLNDETRLLTIGLTGNEDAARQAAIGMEGFSDEQSVAIDRAREHNEELKSLSETAGGIGDALTEGLLSGDWKSAGQSILGELKSFFVEPLKKQLSSAISGALSGGSGGGLLGGLQSGVSSLMGGISKGISGLFGGSGSLLGGIAGALGPVGLIGGAVSLISGLFSSGPQKVKGRFGSFGDTVQDSRSAADKSQRTFYQTGRSDREFFRNSDFGQFGVLSAGSQSIGRDDDKQIAGLHAALDAMQQLDNVIASFLPPATIERVKTGLDGIESNALNTEAVTRERMIAIFSAMDTELKAAFQGGENVIRGTAEQIAGRFAYIAQINESQLMPTMTSLGMNLGNTEVKALAAAVGLADAAGGLDALLAGTQNYIDKFYSETEKQNLAMSQAAAEVEQFNKKMGLTGDAAIDSKKEFRAYVDGLNLQTKAGQEAYAEAMRLVDSMYAVSESGQTLDAIMSGLPKQMLENARSLLKQADATEAAADKSGAALNSVGNSLSSLASGASSAANAISSAAAKIAAAKPAATTASGLIELPKFANGGITSGVSIAGESGPEAVIPLPDGRTVPVSLSMPDMSAFQRVEVYHKGSKEFARDKNKLKWAQTQYYFQEQGTLGGYWDRKSAEIGRKTGAALDESIYNEYDSAMAGLEQRYTELTAASTVNANGIDRNALSAQGWTVAMINSYEAAAKATAQAEKATAIQEEYSAMLSAAEDLRFELKYGAQALEERNLKEAGWSAAMIANKFAIDAEVLALQSAIEAKEAAEQAAMDAAAAEQDRLAAIQSAFDDAMQSESDRLYALQYGTAALEREKLARDGWTQTMIDSYTAQKSMNDELERQISVFESLQSVAIDLRTAANDLQFDSNLGLASPAEMLADARIEVERLAQSALTDPESAAALAGSVQNALSLSREYNASSAAYVADFERYTGLLDSVAGQIETLQNPVARPTPDRSMPFSVDQNVIDARPVFQSQQQNTETQRENAELKKQNIELQKQIVALLKEVRDDQRTIGSDAYGQRAEGNNEQKNTSAQVKQLREQQRSDARFQGVA